MYTVKIKSLTHTTTRFHPSLVKLNGDLGVNERVCWWGKVTLHLVRQKSNLIFWESLILVEFQTRNSRRNGNVKTQTKKRHCNGINYRPIKSRGVSYTTPARSNSLPNTYHWRYPFLTLRFCAAVMIGSLKLGRTLELSVLFVGNQAVTTATYCESRVKQS